MAKYAMEEIMCDEKYNIESEVFMEVFRLVEKKTNAKTIREQLNMISELTFILHSKRIRLSRPIWMSL